VSSLLCIVLATRTVVGFDSAREKLISGAALPHAGDTHVAIDAPRASRLEPPFAVIARVRNQSSDALAIEIRVDNQAACSRTVPGDGAEHRIDCAWSGEWVPGLPHDVQVVGGAPIPRWSVTYLELATHHGATRGYDLIVVPAIPGAYAHPSRVSLVFAFMVIALVFLLPEARMTPALRCLHNIFSVAIVSLLAAVAMSPHVSSFLVLLSTSAYWQSVLLLTAPRVASGAARAWGALRRTPGPAGASLAVATIVLALFGTVVAQRLRTDYHANYSGFLQLSRRTFDQHPILSRRADIRSSLVLNENGGYDAQFIYFAVFDPFLRTYHDRPETYRLFIDAPPYRLPRVGFSLLTKLFSGDRWQLYPVTMTWLILMALFFCGLTLALIAHAVGASPAWGLIVACVPGFWVSVQSSLPEPIAAAFLLGGFLCVRRDRWKLAGALFAMSLLVRETGAILVVCLAFEALVHEKHRHGLALLTIALAPLLAWRLYVGWILAPDWGLQAFWFNPHDLAKPFVGIADLWGRIHRGEYFPGVSDLSRAGTWYPMVLIGGFAAAIALALKQPSGLTLAAVAYGVLAICLAYPSIWVHVGNAQRGTYELFIVLALVSSGIRCLPRPVHYGVAAFWAASAAYVFLGSFDADYIRQAAFAML
jgi:hypothetical protein